MRSSPPNRSLVRSGWRVATRTEKSCARRWRTIRRPRKPVPPSTVTRRSAIAPHPSPLPASGEREKTALLRRLGAAQRRRELALEEVDEGLLLGPDLRQDDVIKPRLQVF